ncbi:hypothetical protein DESAMIL20_652 [Desulfurella amilsii]|jgi:hypothetical protein|uniref:Uncharacterized protein n=1 Tax=Desulfurella amilsii TaxID=1562698 RepID=A0A1X4XYC6_9BACT|nr:hypothetical protein [Desulfurella amilsii]OSS42537.1 hypothetical protein DESAMIL20_652 [Desulfurella amilsii]
MLIKRDYKRIIDELYKIDGKMVFIDCFVDNYDYKSFSIDYKPLLAMQVTQDNFIEIIAEIVNKIINKSGNYKELLDKLISRNNTYIKTATYDKLNFEQLKEILDEHYMPSIHKYGVTPDMMLLYYFSKHIFNNEIINKLVDYYKTVYKKLLENEKQYQKTGSNFFKDSEKLSLEMLELNNFADERYVDVGEIDWNGIGTKFDCVYDNENKAFNGVKRGIMLFLSSKLYIFSELYAKNDTFYTILKQFWAKLNAFREKQELIVKQTAFLKEENANLKDKYQKAKKQLLEFEKVTSQIKNESDKTKDKQLTELTKENSYLKSRIETLESKIEELLQAQEINKTIAENIEIKESNIIEFTKELPEYQNIVILGGNWNSKEKETLQKALQTCYIEFIDAEKTLTKIDKVVNADIVIFDTSRNAHAYYYKIKQYPIKLFHINKSKSDEVLKIWD